MTAGDFPEVLALWRSVEGVGLNESDSPEALADYLARNPGLSLVARCEGQIVAAVLCGHDGRRGYLHHVAVAAGHRRRGLGRRLVERCLKDLAAERILRCSIFLQSRNSVGRNFWLDQGWNERTDLVIMQRNCKGN
ncbi:MAG: GNAT family N-acetyltransferase [Planctomycetia bacterium]|nr:GNAT family N-acetyltransferase [Planctomycetia bacterium]